MADKVSTLRFRVEGTPEVQSKIEELNRAITRQQRQLAQSVKAASQSPVDTTERYQAAKRAQQDAEQLARLHAMRSKEQEDQQKRELANAQKGLDALAEAENKAYIAEQMPRIKAMNAANKLAEKARADEAKTAEAAKNQRLSILSRELDEQSRMIRERAGGGDGRGGSLSGFGGKMILGMAAGQVAGDVTGDAATGSAVGSIASAAMFGGPGMAAAVAGLEVVGMAFNGQRAAAEASRKAVTDYDNALLNLSATWRNLATSMIQQSPFGDAMDREFQRASASAVKLQQDLAKHLMLPPTAEDTVTAYANWMRGMSPVQAAQNTPYALTASGIKDQRDLQKAMAEASRQERDAEYPKHLADVQRLNQAEKDRYAIAGMAPGYLKKQAELTAGINQEETKRQVGNEEQNRQQQSAVDMARKLATETRNAALFRRPGTTQAEADALTAAADKAQQDFKDAVTAQRRLPAQQAEEKSRLDAKTKAMQDAFDLQQRVTAAEEKGQADDRSRAATAANILDIYKKQRVELANRHEAEMRQAKANPATASTVNELARAQAEENRQLEVGIAQQKNEEKLEDKYKADQAELSLIKDDYTRAVSELERRFEEEKRLYDRAGKDTTELVRGQEEEKAKLRQDGWKWAQEQLDTLNPKHPYAEAKMNDRLNALLADGAISREDYDKLQKRHDIPLELKANREDLESAYKMHGISYKAYKLQSLKLDNPNASDEALGRLYESERRKDMSEHWGDFRRQSFSSDYAPGRVDFKALAGGNINNQIDATRQGNEWLRQIFMALNQRQGLN